jgi:hypothetical protein
VASTLKVANPRKNQLLAAFNSIGHLLVQTYYDPKLFKTTATPDQVYDIFKQWKKESGGSQKLPETSLGGRILQKEPLVKPIFDEEQVKTLI